ncbi:glycosyl hydrolase family 65 protein [Cohnella lubricantis]|uniref:Glycoside hydrolase n=1 Tax=Cohnella lubricantis TaxID=2163172 RepID=A0A841TAD4_9BACL|nr:glycosyl hydrolase family 65 protein [Cohnella lubricantis]MBB6677026.1 hypothetical protein [Cohnella lubricantis]MBP2119307.1 hypothetical protein [Cohnella lubricantis]
MLLQSNRFKHYIDRFNEQDEETVAQAIPNESAWQWLGDTMPLFECPDRELEETYYFRWWVYRKHLKHTTDGSIITEFHPDVPWAGKHNSINCAVGHHLNEGRWLSHRREFLDDYIQFWLRKGGSVRSYSCWLADSIWSYCQVTGDLSFAIRFLPDLIDNFKQWEESNLNESGLFWSYDDRDAMEHSISGSGLRPTLNSYMYADATAIAQIAAAAGDPQSESEFRAKADRLKKGVQERLWDEQDRFFKVIPLEKAEDLVQDWDFRSMDPAHNVREQIGFIPWYFNLPDPGYEEAWKQLLDPEGFGAQHGPTTAEQRHHRFMFPLESHECLWNGPSWPFATSQTLTALANVLNHYSQPWLDRADYLDVLRIYAKSHYRKRKEGTVVSWLDENLDPFTGEWLSRRILEGWGWPKDKGGRERGKDYNHSTYTDLIITGLVGLRPRSDEILEVNPLVPQGKWDYFCLDRVNYRGKMVTIVYDKTGERYKKGSGLAVYVNGCEVGRSNGLSRIEVI